MNGSFGVFCGVDLIGGTFGTDDDADSYLRDLVEAGEYDRHHLEVREVPDDYDIWHQLLSGLRSSRSTENGENGQAQVRELRDDSTRV